MKNSELTYPLIGIVVLAIIAWFVFGNDRPDIQENINPNPEEVVDTESELDNPEETTQEDTLAPSRGQGSFATNQTTGGAENITRQKTTASVPSSYYTELFPGIFTLGVYYLENINKKGIDACKGRTEPDPESVNEDIEYTDENFELEQIMYKNGQVFLSINAQEIPEDMCAYIIQKELGTSPFSAVHLIVQ
tara:strand:- start:37 stop:612 length:576 start_codon:yes stop_codon:yes gene_type:complete